MVDAWAESALTTINEIITLLHSREHAVKDASSSNSRGHANLEALENRVSDLQNKLYEAERKNGNAESQRIVIGAHLALCCVSVSIMCTVYSSISSSECDLRSFAVCLFTRLYRSID